MNELFFILFLSVFIFFSTFTINLMNSAHLIELSSSITFLIFTFAVPKKRKKKTSPLKKNVVNKTFTMRRLNVKSIHFDEFFNNMPKWEEYK